MRHGRQWRQDSEKGKSWRSRLRLLHVYCGRSFPLQEIGVEEIVHNLPGVAVLAVDVHHAPITYSGCRCAAMQGAIVCPGPKGTTDHPGPLLHRVDSFRDVLDAFGIVGA